MRAARALLLLIGTTLPALTPASANDGFSIVVPGRAGVPIIINGVDASWAVVESDWGLAKNVHVQPTVYGGRIVDPGPPVGHYYPSAGHMPGYGRLEIQPPANRKLPQRGAKLSSVMVRAVRASSRRRVTSQLYPPAVIVAPENGACRFAAGFPAIEITGNFATNPYTQPRKQIDRRE